MAQAESVLENARSDNADRVIAQATERLVLSDLASVPALPELAARVGTHEKRLTRAFREQTGRTVYEFVREMRLVEAQRLLLNSALNMEEVAHAVGFSGAANFSTAVRERFGLTPSSYRNARAARPMPPFMPVAAPSTLPAPSA